MGLLGGGFWEGFYEGWTGESFEQTLFSGCMGCGGTILKWLIIIGVVVAILVWIF